VPSAGNAAGALAAYAARAGIEAHIFMPKDTPRANVIECEQTGSHVTLMDGLITDCGAEVARRKEAEGWFDVSTLKEPYRIEGKKTMGYELGEQLDWELPDVIIYPTGGGTGIVGMWKAFEELEAIGWLMPGRRPKMVAVQTEGCAPIVRAFHEGTPKAAPWENPHTVADGLRVPKAIGDFIMLKNIRDSGGTGIAVSDAQMIDDMFAMGKLEGVSAAPEGATTLSAARMLVADGRIKPHETVVLFNTGGALKYLDLVRFGHLERG
jgi:threonine synthase